MLQSRNGGKRLNTLLKKKNLSAGASASNLMCKHLAALQIVALREQNAHLQRKVASGEGDDDLLEGEAQQKIHGKVSLEHSSAGKICCRII